MYTDEVTAKRTQGQNPPPDPNDPSRRRIKNERQYLFEWIVRLNCPYCQGEQPSDRRYGQKVVLEDHRGPGQAYYHYDAEGYFAVCKSSELRLAFPEMSDVMNGHTG